jgi:hypothetical protein
LDVTPAVDIYSLGKVIYFMLSGGTIVPRERLHEDPYRAVFHGGEQYRLLELLLRRMITDIGSRISDMDTVIRELEKIEQWEQNARQLPISTDGLTALDQLQRRSLETARVRSENADARQRETDNLETVRKSIHGWLEAELAKVAAHISSSGTLKAEVRDAQSPNGGSFLIGVGLNSAYRTQGGVELVVEDQGANTGRKHALQFYFATYEPGFVTVRSNVVGKEKPAAPELVPARDVDVAVIPLYRQTINNQHPSMSVQLGYVSAKTTIGTVRTFIEYGNDGTGRNRRPGRYRAAQQRSLRVEPIMPTFDKAFSLHSPFKLSEWPTNEAALRRATSDAIDTFLKILSEA